MRIVRVEVVARTEHTRTWAANLYHSSAGSTPLEIHGSSPRHLVSCHNVVLKLVCAVKHEKNTTGCESIAGAGLREEMKHSTSSDARSSNNEHQDRKSTYQVSYTAACTHRPLLPGTRYSAVLYERRAGESIPGTAVASSLLYLVYWTQLAGTHVGPSQSLGRPRM